MIPLTEATRRAKPRAKSVTLREITPTKTQADDLAAIYLEVVRLWRNVAAEIVSAYDPPALTTDSQPEIEAALTTGQRAADALIVVLTARAKTWAERVAFWHTRKWAVNVLGGTGVSIDAWLTNAAIADDLAASLAWNTSLIRNVSDQTRDRISNIVWAGYRARTPRRDIARAMNEAVGLGRRRALLIGQDQAVKLSGALDRSRMLEAGIDQFIWRHSLKLHPRKEHVERNGKIYRWDSEVAMTDPPGQAIHCGCKAQSYLSL
jgi:SPP1 gp7 family putative phage head morphogenesis protein